MTCAILVTAAGHDLPATMIRVFAAPAVLLPMIALASPQVIVSDGDTIKVDGIKMRIIGYDTPETRKQLCEDGDPYRERRLGFKATNRLRQLLREQSYEIRDHNRTDRFGRELVQVVVNGRDVADILINEGLAIRYDCPRYRCPRRGDWCDRLR